MILILHLVSLSVTLHSDHSQVDEVSLSHQWVTGHHPQGMIGRVINKDFGSSELQPQGYFSGLFATGDTELVVDAAHLRLDGVDGDDQLIGDFGVR
jgi:hypothetical protein